MRRPRPVRREAPGVSFEHAAAVPVSALTAGGVHIPNSGNGGLGFVLKAALLSTVVHQQGRPYVSTVKRADLEYLAGLMAAGRLRSVIDSTYPLARTAEAFRRAGAGHARGKVVVTLEEGSA